MPRPISLPDPWRSLAEQLGGVQALADALHSDPTTIRRWAKGQRLRGPARALIDLVFRSNGIEPPC